MVVTSIFFFSNTFYPLTDKFYVLTHNPDFIRPLRGRLWKTVRKGENAGKQHLLIFPPFSTLSMLNLPYAIALNLVTFQIFSFGKGLIYAWTRLNFYCLVKGEITRNPSPLPNKNICVNHYVIELLPLIKKFV